MILMDTKDRAIVLFIFLLVAFSLNLFEARFALEGTLKYVRNGVIVVSILLSLPYIFTREGGFTGAIQLICLSIIISIYMARVSWGQGYLDTIKSTIPYMVWFFYFFLLHFKVPLKILENIIIIYGIIYMLLFTFQFLNSDIPYFGYHDQFKEDRGIIRVNFPGGGVFFLTTFIALTRFREQVNYKWFWLGIIFVGLTIVILQVTRQNIAAVLLICIFHFMRHRPFYQKFGITTICCVAVLFISTSNSSIVQGLINIKDRNNEISTNNIRFKAADYFINNFSPNTYNMIFGNGVPYTAKTDYGYVEADQMKKGYYLTDIGLIAMYALFGVLAIAAYVILFVKSFILKIDERYIYLKYYVFYLLITCLTSSSVFHSNFLITNIFVFYGLQSLYRQKKEKKLYKIIGGQIN